MDRCTKFKVFNVALLFCVANFFIYRFFAYPGVSPFRLSSEGGATPAPGTGTEQWRKSNSLTQARPKSSSSDQTGKGTDTPKKGPLSQGGPDGIPKTSKAAATRDAEKTTAPEPKKTQASSKPAGTKDGPTVGITSTSANGEDLPMCPLVPPILRPYSPKSMGPLATYSEGPDFEKIAALNKNVKPGGKYKPPNCVSRHRVAIIIPYRNREQHLRILLHNLHPMLQRQQLDYGIFVIDQEMPTRFNRAMLMNIGYVEAMKRYDYQCVVFHDVDLIPENDHNIYSCPKMPRHLSAAIDKFKYRLPYVGIYGGASAMTKQHMQLVNGFSNLYFGWGGEDDDMSTRIRAKGLKISRYPMEIARYRMIKHVTERGNEVNPQRHNLLKSTAKRMPTDGLNSLKYTVKNVTVFPTHLRILVYIDQNDYKV